eukprot:4464753-Amphidinium_carterae.1
MDHLTRPAQAIHDLDAALSPFQSTSTPEAWSYRHCHRFFHQKAALLEFQQTRNSAALNLRA